MILRHRHHEGHVLGAVSHHFVKKEYQARRVPHYHMVLWMEGTPTIGKDAPAVVLKWIQERISCRIPNEATNPELYRLVTRYQMHKYSSCCKRTTINELQKKDREYSDLLDKVRRGCPSSRTVTLQQDRLIQGSALDQFEALHQSGQSRPAGL